MRVHESRIHESNEGWIILWLDSELDDIRRAVLWMGRGSVVDREGTVLWVGRGQCCGWRGAVLWVGANKKVKWSVLILQIFFIERRLNTLRPKEVSIWDILISYYPCIFLSTVQWKTREREREGERIEKTVTMLVELKLAPKNEKINWEKKIHYYTFFSLLYFLWFQYSDIYSDI